MMFKLYPTTMVTLMVTSAWCGRGWGWSAWSSCCCTPRPTGWTPLCHFLSYESLEYFNCVYMNATNELRILVFFPMILAMSISWRGGVFFCQSTWKRTMASTLTVTESLIQTWTIYCHEINTKSALSWYFKYIAKDSVNEHLGHNQLLIDVVTALSQPNL